MTPKEQELADKILDAALASTTQEEQYANVMLYGQLISAVKVRIEIGA